MRHAILADAIHFLRGEALKNKFVSTARSLVDVYVKHHVARSAAALSYSLTLSIFPILICVSAILASLHIPSQGFVDMLENIIPAGAIDILSDFLVYVGNTDSTVIIIVGLSVMITSSSAGFRTIMGIFSDIQGASRFSGVFGMLFSFILSFAFLIVIFASALIIISGSWLLQFLETYFSVGNILAIWQWLRFVLLFLLLFSVIYLLYFAAAPKATKRLHRLPGAMVSSVLLVGVSIVFSSMISQSAKYTLVYGTLASFIILLVWLYLCSIVLIMGNVYNIVRQPDWRKKDD